MVERRRNDLASRSCAAISLTFIILVTPWAIQQVITSVTRTTVRKRNRTSDVDLGYVCFFFCESE